MGGPHFSLSLILRRVVAHYGQELEGDQLACWRFAVVPDRANGALGEDNVRHEVELHEPFFRRGQCGVQT